jgi:hypothetical protein
METMIERGTRLQEISSAVETLMDNPSIKRLDGDGWKAYRVVDQIRVDIDNLNKEEQ